jgi:hypothetical protein
MASYIPKSIDGGDSVAPTLEAVREQADRSAIAYRLWLACGDGEPKTPYTLRDEADYLRDLIYLRSSPWLCREDLSHPQTNGTALEMIIIRTESTRTYIGAI